MFQSLQFLTEIFHNYDLIKQHSSSSSYLCYVNTLPCGTEQQKLRLNKSAVKPYLVKWQNVQTDASQSCTNSLYSLYLASAFLVARLLFWQIKYDDDDYTQMSSRKHLEQFLHTVTFVFLSKVS